MLLVGGQPIDLSLDGMASRGMLYRRVGRDVSRIAGIEIANNANSERNHVTHRRITEHVSQIEYS